ncbi:unnamed protein product, partial [Musa acuminata var. zebrina]
RSRFSCIPPSAGAQKLGGLRQGCTVDDRSSVPPSSISRGDDDDDDGCGRPQVRPADGARGVPREPRVDAAGVEPVAALPQHPDGVAAAELRQAHGAVPPHPPRAGHRGVRRHQERRQHGWVERPPCRLLPPYPPRLLVLLVLLVLGWRRAEGQGEKRADDDEAEDHGDDPGGDILEAVGGLAVGVGRPRRSEKAGGAGAGIREAGGIGEIHFWGFEE